MTKAHSSGAAAPSKSPKPYPDFPLFAHATRRWCKKIRGRLVYFGKWEDADGALKRYLDQKDALHAGRDPAAAEGFTVFSLCGRFLTSKKNRLDSGELSIHPSNEYTATCKRLIKTFGRNRPVSAPRPQDFERYRALIAKRWGPVRLGNEIMRVRSVFKFAVSDCDEAHARFGEQFRRPSAKVLRRHWQEQGPKMFEATEIKRMLVAAGQPLRAMILLGINCGYGNSDLGTLPLNALNFKRGWRSYARPKTGIDRRCPLWPETIRALGEWLKLRPEANKPEHAGLEFLALTGDSWAKQTMDNPISKETRKLLDKLGIDGHRNFYALRHTFRTIADAAKDQLAADYIMGHAPRSDDMASLYHELIADDRLRAVTDYVRLWLWSRAKVRCSHRAMGG